MYAEGTMSSTSSTALRSRLTRAQSSTLTDSSALDPGPGLSSSPTVAIVLKGSRAEQGGLKIGDLIVEINGHPILSRQAVREVLVGVTLDQPLRLAVRREGERLVLTLGPTGTGIP